MNSPVPVSQSSFTSGEWSPSLYGRVDLAKYYTGLKTCRNWITRPYGGVMNRAGTRFCGSVKDPTKKVRLIPFSYSDDQTLVMEMGEYYIRFWTDAGMVVHSSGDPVEVTTPFGGDQLFELRYAQNGDVVTFCHPDLYPRQLSRYSNESWALTTFPNTLGPFQDMNIDEGITVYVSGTTGTVTVTASDDIFTEDMVGMLMRIEQAADLRTHRWEADDSGINVNDIRMTSEGNYYKALTSGTTGTVRPSVLEGVESDGSPGIVWQYLHSGFGIVEISNYISSTRVTATVISRLPESLVSGSNSATIVDADCGTHAAAGEQYDNDYTTVTTAAAHPFSTGDVVTISGATGMTSLNGSWTVTSEGDANQFIVPLSTSQEYTSGGLAQKTLSAKASYKWSMGAWGEDQGYPRAVIYHQQRQIFGGGVAAPQRVWESRSGSAHTDFGQNAVLEADDALTFELAANQANAILHFVVLRALVALTSEGVWTISKNSDEIIPDANFQGRGGSSDVAPVVVGSDALYVQRKGGAIRALRYFFDSDSYQGRDLTLTANHLFQGKQVVDWAYQEVPFSCVWIVMSDGSLLGLTYQPEQEITGWHRHDSGNGVFESVCCVSEGDEDAAYVVVRRIINGETVRYIERFQPRFFTDPRDAFFVDSGLTYDGRDAGAGVGWALSTSAGWTYQDTLTFTTDTDFFTGESDVGDILVVTDSHGEALRLTIVAYASATVVSVMANRTVPEEFQGTSCSGFDVARNTLTGLGHLEGETVSILADGNVSPRQTVSSGSVTLGQPAVVVHVGLPIICDIETLDLNVQGDFSRSYTKNVSSVDLLLEDTRGLWAGPDEDHLLEMKPTMSGSYSSPVEPVTGLAEMNIVSNWSTGGRVFVRQTDPLPATILSAIPKVAMTDG